MLERSGWSVHDAVNGAEALALLSPAPNVVLLDLTMPVMDGFDFLHRLRGTRGCADIPVVVLSAREVSGPERDRLSGADRILKKGEASMNELAAELRHLRLNHYPSDPDR